VEALLAEQFTDQVRCPVHHLGLAVKALGGGYIFNRNLPADLASVRELPFLGGKLARGEE